MKNKKGFTLTEMMVVVLIIAGLASVAYPVYTKVITKARIAEAISLGEIVREAQQRSLAVSGSYFSGFTQAHTQGRTRIIKSGDVELSGSKLKKGLYTISITNALETASTNAVPNGCIVVKFNKEGSESNTIFTIYMHVEDSRMWCQETDGSDKICSAISTTLEPINTLDCQTNNG